MTQPGTFNFGNDSIARAYDDILVPSLFQPWAESLIRDNGPWQGLKVLELACGTGVVTRELVQQVLPDGQLIALDLNQEMLNIAQEKCDAWPGSVLFIQGTADASGIEDQSVDKIVCQQGFQFFEDKRAVAKEIYRILKPNGEAIISTWSKVSQCDIFHAVCISLEALGYDQISKKMRLPFDLVTKETLQASFQGVGFSDIRCYTEEQPLVIKGGLAEAVNYVYATPIAPELEGLEKSVLEKFEKLLIPQLEKLQLGNNNFGKMTSNFIKIRR